MRLFRLWRTSGNDLRLLAAALRNSSRPAWLIPATIGLLLFTLDPFNFALPLIGVIDDFVLLPILLRWLVRAATAGGRTTMNTSSLPSAELLKGPRR